MFTQLVCNLKKSHKRNDGNKILEGHSVRHRELLGISRISLFQQSSTKSLSINLKLNTALKSSIKITEWQNTVSKYTEFTYIIITIMNSGQI